MTYIPELQGQPPSAESTKVAEEFLSLGRKKEITSAISSLISDEFDRLEDYASEHISETAGQRAKDFLERVLHGDEEAAKKLFGGCEVGDRYRQLGYDEGKPWASLIYGSLFETGSVSLRRKLVEAHADLLINERIKDLESVIEGLTIQIRTIQAEKDALYERFR